MALHHVVASQLDELADLLEIGGANPFRVRAYRNAARLLESFTEDLHDYLRPGGPRLTDLEGIGEDLATKIQQAATSGTFDQLEAARQSVPAGVLDLLRIPGLGPKKAKALYEEAGVTSIAALKAAAEEGRLAALKGFGKKTEASLLAAIARLSEMDTRLYLADARTLAEAVRDELASRVSVERLEIAGSCRRGKETVGDLDLLVAADDHDAVMDALASSPFVEAVLARGTTKQRVRLKSLTQAITPGGTRISMELDLRVVPAASMGAALQYFTGSVEHNVQVRSLAKTRGWSLNEYGLTEGEQVIASRDEAEIYSALGLDWIPPELREGRQELEWARTHQLPALLNVADLAGDLHMHTTASDGTATIEQMAVAARERGLKYIAITDHSQRVTMANGLNEERLLAHWQAIREVQQRVEGIQLLCGVECDILEDARLDITDEVLAQADWVVAVLHFGLNQPQEQIRRRLLSAIESPHVDAIGHLTGRLIGKRPGADVPFPEIVAAAVEHRTLLEINAHPSRLDLDDVRAAKAAAAGIPIVINSDAHSTAGFDVLPWGVVQGRRAGLTAAQVANTWTWSEIQNYLARS